MADAKARAALYVAERLGEARQQQLSGAAVKALLLDNENTKRSLEANLRALTEARLQGTEASMALLGECVQSVPRVVSRFEQMDSLAAESDALLRDFPFDLNQVRENLFQTRRLLRDMVRVNERCEKVKKLLEDEEALLEAHAELAELCEMRVQAVLDSQKAGDRFVMDGVERFFRGVGKLEARFDDLIKQHMDATFELARKRPSLLKQVLKVIELEEKADRSRPPELLKGYQVTFREKLREALENRFNAVFANAVKTDITEALLIVEQIYDNLPIIQQVNRFFPSKYMMYEFYAGNIHRNLRACLAQVAELPTLNSGDVMNLYYWANVTYTQKLESLSLNPREWPITDMLKPAVPKYTAALRTLMHRWSETLLQRDRTSPLYVEIPQCLMTDSIVTLFKFVNEQLDLVSNARDSHFIFEVSKETSRVLAEFQRAQMIMLSDEMNGVEMRYLLAVLNNNAKAQEYVEEYGFKVRSLISEPELSRFEKDGDRASLAGGFERVRLMAVSCVVSRIFDLFRESNVLAKLFGRDWVQPPADTYQPMEIAVMTLAEALEQLVRRHARDKFVSDVAQECLDRLLQRYVQELCNKSAHNERTAACIERDKQLVSEAFAGLLDGRAFLTRRLNLMGSMAVFISTPMDDHGQFILTYNSLLTDFPDLSPEVVKRIISARSDCDKEALNDVIAACRGILPPAHKAHEPFFAAISLKGAKEEKRKGAVAAISAAVSSASVSAEGGEQQTKQ